MAFTIEDLQIEFESNDTSAAVSGIDALARSLERLKNAVGGDLGGASSNMNRIAAAMRNLKGVGDLNLSNNVKQLRSLQGVAEKLSNTDMTAFSDNILSIAVGIETLGSVPVPNLGGVSNAIQKLFDTVTGMDAASMQKFSSQVNVISDSMSVLSGIEKGNIGSVVSQLKQIPDLTKNLDIAGLDNFSSQMGKIASGMAQLNTIEKGNLGSVVNQLKKIPEVTQALDPNTLDQFAAAVQRLTQIMGPLATQMESVSRGFAALPNRMRAAITASNQLATTNRRTASSYGSLSTSISRTITKLTVFGFAFRRVVDVFADALNESNDYIENLNLFRVSMGDATEEAMEFAETVQELMGIDISEWIQNQGVFMRLATGFGIAADQAEVMSQNLTQLGYDMASFFNTDVETAMKKLQSGMTGQIKGLKAFGINISVAALQETALALGIDQSVRSMTEAQKAQLRYITILQRSQGIMGDMGRTLVTPANALRILSSQFTQLKRAIGNVVSVIAVALIPYVQALVEIITDAAIALAEFFGFEMPEIDYSGLDLGADFIDDIGDGIEDTTKAAGDLKRQLMGFDELNVLKDPTAGAGDVKGGASYDLGIDMSDFSYDFLAGLDGRVDDIKERMKAVLDVALAVGAALLAWKVANALPGGLSKIDDLLTKITKTGPVTLLNKGTIAALPQLISGIALAGGLIYTAWQNSEDFRNGCSALLDAGRAAFDGISEAVGNLVEKLNLPELNGETLTRFASGASMAIGIIATALGAPILGGIAAFAGAAVLSIQSIGDAASKEYRGFEDIGANLGAALTSGLAIGLATFVVASNPVAAVIAGLVAAAVAFGTAMSTDAVQGVEIFNDTITKETREKVEPFLNKMRELSDTLVTLEYTGQIIDDSVVEDVAGKMAEIKNLITTELDADQTSATDMLGSLKGFMGEGAYAELLAANESYYAQAKENLTAYEAEVNAIMQQAAAENRAVTEAEWAEIYRIQDEMQSMGVSALSESAIEYETIMRNLKDNSTRVSLEQASEIIKNAQETRDETIKAAEDQYSSVLLEAKRMLEAGVINEEQYQTIIDAAKEAKDSTVADAIAQYDSILNTTKEKLGEAAKYIDTETGDIKTKWQVFTDDLATWWGETWDNITQGWNDFKTTFKTGWDNFWDAAGETVDGAINGVISAVERGLNWCIDALNGLSWDVPDWVPWVGGETFGFDIPKVSLGRVNFFADGGFPSMGEMFIAREAGPELVGRIGNKTAVANNDQIVSGIAAGVHDANQDLISAAYAIGTQIITAIRENSGDVYLDGEKVSNKVTTAQKQHDRMYG